MNSLVSVILPVRNGEKQIREAIDSVLAQTYPHYELVVVDASDDSTPEIIKSYNDPRICYHRQTTKGSVNGYNEALDNYISGKYVTFIHHDDVYLPEKLYEQVRMMERFSDVQCVYNDIEFIDANGNLTRVRGHEDFYHRNDDLLSVMMIGYGVSNLGMNVLVRRDFIEVHNLRYSLETPICCDHEFIFSLIDVGCTFKHISKPLLRYRVHNENYSGDRDAVNRENLKIYSRYSNDELKSTVERSYFSEEEKRVIFGKLLFRLGRTQEAIDHFVAMLAKSESPWAAFYLGTGFYRFLGDFENALVYLEKGFRWMPYRAEFANNIGCCLYQKGEVAGAHQWFDKALQLEPHFYDAEYNLSCSQNGSPFNPRITDREIIPQEQMGVVWKGAEGKRQQSKVLDTAGNI